MKNLKNQKGITLVALVVTIIVLLILAGVSLRLVAGDEGILKRSETAVNKTTATSIEERADLGIANAKLAYLENKYDGTKTYSSFAKFLSDVSNATAGDLNEIKGDIEKAGGSIEFGSYDTAEDTITIKFESDGYTYTKTIKADEVVTTDADKAGWVKAEKTA